MGKDGQNVKGGMTMQTQVKGLVIKKGKNGYWLVMQEANGRIIIRTKSQELATRAVGRLGAFANWHVDVDVLVYLETRRPDLYHHYLKVKEAFDVEERENLDYEKTKDHQGYVRYYVMEEEKKRNVKGIPLLKGLAMHEEPNGKWTIDHVPSALMLSELSTQEKAFAVAKKMEGLLDWEQINAPDVILECQSMRHYLTSVRQDAEERKALQDPPEELSYELLFLQNDHLKGNWHLFKSAWNELNALIGLDEVKEQIRGLLAKERGRMRNRGLVKERKSSMHMMFLGSPGTGKTEVARIIGKFFYALGYLEKDVLKEVKRADIVGSVIGQTEEKFTAILKEAMGGVLFIDEAYDLARETANDFGREAINLLIAEMENRRDEFIVILAGYTNDMENLMDMNEGFRSRIRHRIPFPDYTPEQLTDIGMKMLTATGYQCKSGVRETLKQTIANKARNGVLEGNARGVRNIVDETIDQAEIRIGKDLNAHPTLIIKEDVLQVMNPKRHADAKGLEEISEKALSELNQLIGLSELKEEVKHVLIQAKMSKRRQERGIETKKPRHHMIFSGPAGTGKTTVAKIIGTFFKGTGILSSGHFKKVNRADLVGEYQGHTAKKVQRVVNEAKGGVLFIDEAYLLVSSPNDSFGLEAVGILIDMMEEYKDDLVVILAGYDKDINQLLQYNEGFSSRIGHRFTFPNYTTEDIINIILLQLKKDQFNISTQVKQAIQEEVQKIAITNGGTFNGNGRWAEEFSNDIRNALDFRVYKAEKNGVQTTHDMLMTIEPQDIVFAANAYK